MLRDLGWERLEEKRKANRLAMLINNGFVYRHQQATTPAAKRPRNPTPTAILPRQGRPSSSFKFLLPKDPPRVGPSSTWHTRTPPIEAFVDGLGSGTDGQCHASPAVCPAPQTVVLNHYKGHFKGKEQSCRACGHKFHWATNAPLCEPGTVLGRRTQTLHAALILTLSLPCLSRCHSVNDH